MEKNENNIFNAMNSLFRLSQMIKVKMPDIILDVERSLLKERFNRLNADEIYLLFLNWPKYYEDRMTEDVIQDEQCKQDFEREIINLN